MLCIDKICRLIIQFFKRPMFISRRKGNLNLAKNKDCDKILLKGVQCSVVDQCSIFRALQIAVGLKNVRC